MNAAADEMFQFQVQELKRPHTAEGKIDYFTNTSRDIRQMTFARLLFQYCRLSRSTAVVGP